MKKLRYQRWNDLPNITQLARNWAFIDFIATMRGEAEMN